MLQCIIPPNCSPLAKTHQATKMDVNLALHAAIDASDMENFDRLLHHPDVDINYKNASGETLLMASIEKREFGSTMAMSLIRADCDLNCKSLDDSSSLLHLAVKHNLVDVAHELILRGAPIDEVSELFITPLGYAIENDNVEAVCLLLYYQADVNAIANNWGQTHFPHAVQSNSNGVCELLLDYCYDISAEDNRGDTALTLAIESRNPIAIKLFKRGADDYYRNLLAPLVDFPLWNSYSNFSYSEWLECLYLILQSAFGSIFIREYESSIGNGNGKTMLLFIMMALLARNVELKDRISILYICFSLGAEIKTQDLRLMRILFGSNEEFEAVLYAGELSYNDYKKQMGILLADAYNSYMEIVLYYNLPSLSNKMFCSLGFFSISPGKRRIYMSRIEVLSQRNLNVLLEKLKTIPQFPSLLELSRTETQKFIEEKFNILKAYQFYDVVKSLKLPPIIEDIILFKQRIY